MEEANRADWNDEYIKMIHDDTGRSLMGSRQENWLYRHLSDSASRGTAWRVIGSQIKFARHERTIDGEVTYSTDGWDVSSILPDSKNELTSTGLSRKP